ncbi:metallophosphoesterase [Bacillus sp. S14(2024)]|uniref:metallophosphoesterase n=1 Tax=Bacillus sp. S14(2024) TaxID=3162884 RepID=UPI003D23095C
MTWGLLGCFILCIVIGCFVMMYREAMRDTLLEHTVSFAEFPMSFGEVRIFFISDIHRRTISKSLIQQVKGKVDLVIIGGDLAEQGVPLARVVDNIKRLNEIGQVYFVWGNNDYEIDFHELDALLLQSGVKILDNTGILFESEAGEKIWLLGVDDVGLKRDRLDLALADCEEEGFRILVSHNPDIVYKLNGTENISCVFSGHTHGGQIRLFHATRFLKGGIHEYPQTTLFVSNGYGTTFVPMRFRAPAQTHLITLQRKD